MGNDDGIAGHALGALAWKDKEIAALRADVERLKEGLKKSNAGFEEYERKYYLALDRLESAERKVEKALAYADKCISNDPPICHLDIYLSFKQILSGGSKE